MLRKILILACAVSVLLAAAQAGAWGVGYVSYGGYGPYGGYHSGQAVVATPSAGYGYHPPTPTPYGGCYGYGNPYAGHATGGFYAGGCGGVYRAGVYRAW